MGNFAESRDVKEGYSGVSLDDMLDDSVIKTSLKGDWIRIRLTSKIN